MQILPDTFLDRAEDALGSRMDALPVNGLFEKEFRRALNDPAPKEDAFAGNRERDADSDSYLAALMADSPYNPIQEVPSPFTPGTARLTAAEVNELVSAMGKDNVSARALNALKDMGGLPGGPTAAQLTQAARKALEGERPALTSQDQALLLSLSQKVGGSHVRELNGLFDSGTPLTALKAFLSGLESDTPLAVSREEMSALIKALGLSESTGDNLLKAFGQDPVLTIAGKEFQKLLEPARKELDTAEREMENLLASLERHLKPVLKDAERREEKERMAALGEDRGIARTRTLIQDRATQAAPGREDLPDQDKQTRAVFRREDRKAPAEEADPARKTARNDGEVHRAAAQNTEPHSAGEQRGDGEELRDRKRGEDRRDAFAAERGSDARQPARAASPSPSPTINAVLSQGVGQSGMPATTAAVTPDMQGQEMPAALPAQTLEQIDQAVLTAFRNGVRRLEVALNPGDLGSMTVVLTTRHGEVSALIQPDRAETAALIAQQTDHIRQQLENQGFKVEKVDVQTQLADQQTGHDWQGADHHNASRDMAERADHLERLRRLSHTSGDSLPGLARDMQISARTATVAAQGLHLIA